MSGTAGNDARRPEDRPYFFDAGLRFGCTECGQCCTGAPGTIFMNEAESKRIARHLGLLRAAFLKRYAYPMEGGHSLREEENGDCVFFRQGRCSIYHVRPTQCRTYPFWPENVRSEAAWSATCRACPGIGQGRLYGREEILSLVQQALEGEGKAQQGKPQSAKSQDPSTKPRTSSKRQAE